MKPNDSEYLEEYSKEILEEYDQEDRGELYKRIGEYLAWIDDEEGELPMPEWMNGSEWKNEEDDSSEEWGTVLLREAYIGLDFCYIALRMQRKTLMRRKDREENDVDS